MPFFECVICMDGIGGNNHIVATKCGHVYHFRCLIKWTKKSKTCPECRKTVTNNNSFKRLFPKVAANPHQADIEALEAQIMLLRSELDEQKTLNKDLMDGFRSVAPKRKRATNRK